MIGYYLLLACVYLPVMRRQLGEKESQPLLAALGRAMLPWIAAALLVFICTGILLMMVNPNYLGLGKFGNSWSIFMVAKHIVVIGMLVAGTRISRSGDLTASKSPTPVCFSFLVRLQAGMGVLVLLLTALARMG